LWQNGVAAELIEGLTRKQTDIQRGSVILKWVRKGGRITES
jgi:hypothetical protein